MKKIIDGENYNSIDLIKFICSILVMMIHIAPFGRLNDGGDIFDLNYFIQNYIARVAAPYFFVSTGFLLFKKTAYTNIDTMLIKKYIVKLFRLYIIWSIIYLPLVIRAFLGNRNGFIIDALFFIRDFIFIGSYSHLWYLNATIISVVLISYFLIKGVRIKKILITALSLYLVGLLAQSWFGVITPMRELLPGVWKIMKIVELAIATTRNGLFEGFLFVGLGMFLAFSNFSISKKKSLYCFLISMVLMLIEIVVLEKANWINGHDMYLFLVPVTFFGFMYIKDITLANSPVYKVLRNLSSLIFIYIAGFWSLYQIY